MENVDNAIAKLETAIKNYRRGLIIKHELYDSALELVRILLHDLLHM